MIAPIGEEERVLQKMWEIFERVLDKAYRAAIACYPDTAELYEIERKEMAVTINKPFRD